MGGDFEASASQQRGVDARAGARALSADPADHQLLACRWRSNRDQIAESPKSNQQKAGWNCCAIWAQKHWKNGKFYLMLLRLFLLLGIAGTDKRVTTKRLWRHTLIAKTKNCFARFYAGKIHLRPWIRRNLLTGRAAHSIFRAIPAFVEI